MAYEEICPQCGAVIVLNEVAMQKRLDRMATHLVTGVNERKKTGNLAQDETYEIECCVKRQTTKAILIETENEEELWIPKSQIDSWNNSEPINKINSIFIPLWLAKEKGIMQE
jgi:hypothetical protein